MGLLLSLFLLQAPGDGWSLVPTAAREIREVYWDLFETTEVFLVLLPEGAKGEPPRVNLVFQGFFSGPARRDPYSGRPKRPGGKASRLALRVQAFPQTFVNDLSLRLEVDGESFDLGAPCRPDGAGPRPASFSIRVMERRTECRWRSSPASWSGSRRRAS